MITLNLKDSVSVGGIDLKNHLILAAGVLGTTGASLNRVLESGAGGVVTKSIGPYPKEGHKGPCVQVLDGAVINAMGLPNPSRDFTEEIAPLKGKPVIASIFGANPEEFAEVASWFMDSAAGFELNVSCPHAEGYGAQIGSDPDLVYECTRAVSKTGKPVWVKLTPNVTSIADCGAAAERAGASALVAINTVRAMRISTDLRKPMLGNGSGGLSGDAIFPIAVKCVWDLYEACDIPIVGCGGVSSADNVIEMMMAGASAVEIGSAVLNGVDIFEKISGELYSGDGVSAEEIVGCAHE
ncbi:dihydroorotate dehydrogenase family protein [Methanolacinia petrolearia DSM 11571]|uniref:Dihydroorotate dehydrogenase n=1 Tax=Methanolacinia petrolearia (strain DSM 11571 / OCM 486 / SEBR 4847) TaxID=679926 RepID=E1RJ08_METP4|nr:dihydroorotate dehydrogenase [Methanolacinia petrolearia]ADN36678.1 dihydroorotate dehydrogenase family protein [Methanolacinia petrolearia DSM 11571]